MDQVIATNQSEPSIPLVGQTARGSRCLGPWHWLVGYDEGSLTNQLIFKAESTMVGERLQGECFLKKQDIRGHTEAKRTLNWPGVSLGIRVNMI